MHVRLGLQSAAVLLVIAGGCAAPSDDAAPDTGRDTPVDAHADVAACDAPNCDVECLTREAEGGNCRDGVCVCFGGPDGGSDVGVCDAVACSATCRATGYGNGECREGTCFCTDGPGTDAGSDAEAAVGVDAAPDAPRTYTCIGGCRNGSEVCDDEGFRVPSPYVPMTLVCVSGRGGTIYVSTNTGPPCLDDGVPRCQGWEQRGQNAWDNLNYVVQFACTEDGRTFDIDLSAYAGEGLYVGVHDNPALGRETMMTQVCVATWD